MYLLYSRAFLHGDGLRGSNIPQTGESRGGPRTLPGIADRPDQLVLLLSKPSLRIRPAVGRPSDDAREAEQRASGDIITVEILPHHEVHGVSAGRYPHVSRRRGALRHRAHSVASPPCRVVKVEFPVCCPGAEPAIAAPAHLLVRYERYQRIRHPRSRPSITIDLEPRISIRLVAGRGVRRPAEVECRSVGRPSRVPDADANPPVASGHIFQSERRFRHTGVQRRLTEREIARPRGLRGAHRGSNERGRYDERHGTHGTALQTANHAVRHLS